MSFSYLIISLLFIATHQNTLSSQKTVEDILPLETVAWSPDGTKIAVGGGGHQCGDFEAHSILIIDANTQQILLTLKGHKCAVVNVAWSPDGSMLVSGSADGTARIWDMATGDELSRSTECAGLTTQTGQVWSPDGLKIADFCDGGHLIQIWNALTGDNLVSYEDSGFINSVSWSPDGSQLAIGSVNAIDLIDAKDASLQGSFVMKAGSMTAIDWSPDGSRIAFAGGDNKIRILDVSTEDIYWTLSGHGDFITALVWSPDSEILASASLDGSVRIWDAEDGQQQAIIESSTGKMNDVDWSPDGSQIAYVGVGIEDYPLQIKSMSDS